MFKRIIVPLDGSERAAQALPLAARIVRASGGTLILLVIMPVHNRDWQEASPSISEMQKAEQERIIADLDRLASASELGGIELVQAVRRGDPAATILEVTREEQGDLIVLCSQGRTGIKRWALGSVAQKVARQSEVPVLVVPANWPVQLPVAGMRALRVQVGLDGSELAESALLPAVWLSLAVSHPLPGELHLLRVLPFSGSFDYEREDVVSRIRREGWQEARRYLERVEREVQADERLQGGRIEVSSAVTSSLDIAETLIRVGETGEGEGIARISSSCDVLALGSHGRSGAARWVMGSIAERVLGATRLPLLIVHPQHTGGPFAEKEHGVRNKQEI